MATGFATVIIMFIISQLIVVALFVLLIKEWAAQTKRAEKLRAEIFEQYRNYMTKSDKTQ